MRRKRRIYIRRQKDSPRIAQVLVRPRQLSIRNSAIEATQDDTDVLIGTEGIVILWCYIPAVVTDVCDPLRGQLLLDAGFADHVDLFVPWQLEHAGYVDRRGVGAAEYLVDIAGDAEVLEGFLVGCAGLCGVVGYKEEVFAQVAEVGEGFDGAGEEGLALPEDAYDYDGIVRHM